MRHLTLMSSYINYECDESFMSTELDNLTDKNWKIGIPDILDIFTWDMVWWYGGMETKM